MLFQLTLACWLSCENKLKKKIMIVYLTKILSFTLSRIDFTWYNLLHNLR